MNEFHCYLDHLSANGQTPESRPFDAEADDEL
jgi:hypothetical protein